MFKGFLSLLTTFMISKFMGQPAAATNMAGISAAMLRKISVMLVLFTVGSLLFFGGFLTILVDLILASYTLGQVTLTSLSWVGAGLMLVAALAYSITFSERFWRPVARPAVQASPLTVALANLVNEFVSERRAPRPSPGVSSAFYNSIHKQPGDSESHSAYMS